MVNLGEFRAPFQHQTNELYVTVRHAVLVLSTKPQ
jgi:hypothetical protein